MPITMIFIAMFAAAGVPSSFTLCKLNREVRTLKVETVAGSNCRATYTKYGKEQNIGEAQNSASCEGFSKRVRGTLEEAGWNCRDIKDVSTTTFSESAE